MAIITISRQRGALGRDIATRLSEVLQIPCFDRQSLEGDGLSTVLKGQIEKFDEKKPSAWSIFSEQKGHYLHFLKSSVYHFVDDNPDCVILGRGGQVLLQGLPALLRISIVAPDETRIERLAVRGDGDWEAAERNVRQSDRDRGGFHRFFFHVDWQDVLLYDLVINTQTIGSDAAVALIRAAAAACDEDVARERTRASISNWCLSQDVIAKLCYEGDVLIDFLEVTAADGVVTINGSVLTTSDAKRAEELARTVSGVTDVCNQLAVVPMTYGIS